MKVQKPKGTVDILPEVSGNWEKVEQIARDFFKQANYREIRTPSFESYEVFSRSSGETSDVVEKEMYDFNDKGGRHIALRPEGTAGVVRSFVENKMYGPDVVKPFNVYYIESMFRYERPQAGRQREFHQIGCESFGSNNPLADIETIMMGNDLLNKLGVKNFELHINSLGNEDVRQKYHDALVDYFTPVKDQLSEDSQRRLGKNPLRILDSKEEQDKQFLPNAPRIVDYLDDESKANFKYITDALDKLGIKYVLDDDLVRGLDYYTGVIFEFMVADTDLWASPTTVLGGGRYNHLVEEFGGPETPAVGFGIGEERLMLVLEKQNPELFADTGIDFFIANIGEGTAMKSVELARTLRKQGKKVQYDVDQKKLKNQFKKADRVHAEFVITLGEKELAEGNVSIKRLADGKQIKFSWDEMNNISEAMKNF
ncbi:histidine--tRNA ligase [Lactobacillus mulieris]|jgi:histidine--tRNA ligase|uniref:Histidine--tRNA ligase n=1 Tax=Lactobacillus mulieris TaxID=2508708 RepID=A0AAP3M369_9LACO|nr:MULTISPECIES: histidine--tRNA ligase [Lactobacillus]EEU21454.1 histidyl-tRNA synthetase [Lactobacillus jensenii 27-2-CHN]EEX24325.1 histidine--tRNA ligase [Lactobacillus jensenii 115-3-CHN]EFH29494.1 histidine--tRNA ligase [Lactobacillus jensenii JV-V16]KAA9244510.1 histidine--tRNA ligase [Lactobacillus jensenii]KAA9371931.1 histidine--tRNA ligase [Lactobacillus jensenii]